MGADNPVGKPQVVPVGSCFTFRECCWTNYLLCFSTTNIAQSGDEAVTNKGNPRQPQLPFW